MALENILKCPLCGQENFRVRMTCKDHTLSNECFTLTECAHCHFLITNPRPDANSIGKYYKSPDYISHSGSTKGIVNTCYIIARHFTLRWKLRIISRLKNPGRLLDFGCGTGEFVHLAGKKGWKAKGVEPSAYAREKAQLLNGLASIYPHQSEIDNEHFDCITLWHVLEHVPDINATLNKLKQSLSPNGLIFVAVPNHLSEDSKIYGETWAGYDVPRHFWHFTQATMEQLMDNHALKIKQILPMRLDAYYVSLLSEKYRNNKSLSLLAYCRALVNGYLSNRKAKTGKDYSSLIYIAAHA